MIGIDGGDAVLQLASGYLRADAALFGSTVDVFQTFDVVFAQVAAGLHFDDFQRDFAGVGQAAQSPKRPSMRSARNFRVLAR